MNARELWHGDGMAEVGEDGSGLYAVVSCDECSGHVSIRPAGPWGSDWHGLAVVAVEMAQDEGWRFGDRQLCSNCAAPR